MSTLKTNNIEHLDATSPSIEVNAAGGIQVGGALTATSGTFTTGTFSGNVSVAGVLSYEDVTNIDSVGVITARNGIDVTGGNVDINSPPWTVTGGNFRNLSISGSDGSSSGFLWLGNGAATTNADFDLGRINFLNGTNIVAQITGTTQTGANDDGRISFLTKETGSSISEKLRITSAGNVGINQISPTALLHTKSGANDGTVISTFEGATNNKLDIKFNSTGPALNVTAGDPLIFEMSGSEKLRIDSAGRISQGGRTPTNHGSPNLLLWGADSTLHISSTESTNNSSNVGIKFAVAGGSTGDYSKAGIFVQRQSSYNDLDMIFAFRSSNDATGVSVSDEKIRIDSDGRLLVGASSSSQVNTAVFQGNSSQGSAPGVILASTINNPSSTQVLGKLAFSDNGHVDAASIKAARDLGTWTSGSSQPSSLAFFTTANGSSSSTERLRIASNGTSFFSSAENVIGAMSATSAGTAVRLYYGSHSSTGISGTVSYTVWTNGDVVNANNSYGSLSDVKLKENIVDARSQWSDIKALQVRNYNFIEGQTHTQIGVVAQEVETVSPGLVTESPDLDDEGNDLGTTTKSVNYSVLYMKAVKALQEAMERIETLEQRLTDAGL